MKKIIFVDECFKMGGVETSFCHLIHHVFYDYEVELHLLNQTHDIPITLPPYIKVVYPQTELYNFLPLSIISERKTLIRNFGFIAYLRKIVHSVGLKLGKDLHTVFSSVVFKGTDFHTCDVCFVLQENTPALYYALDRIKSNKLCCFFHTAADLNKRYIPIYQSDEIYQLITVSQGNKDYLISHMPSVGNKLSVIHNVLVPEEILQKAQLPITYSFSADTFNLVFVGRVTPEKGINMILEAATLLKRNKYACKWYIVGPFDPHVYSKEAFDKDIADLDIKDCVVSLGPQSNPLPFIKAADLLVNPSRIESFGMAIREAQILGIPVIATDTFGARELIQNDVNGSIVPHDVEALAAKIKTYIQETEFTKTIRKTLQQSHFDEKKIIRNMMTQIIGG